MVVITRRSGETKADSEFRKFSRLFMDENIVDELRKTVLPKTLNQKREDAKDLMKARARRKRGRLAFLSTAKNMIHIITSSR